KTPSWRIPDAKSEIAEQVFHTVLLPYAIGEQNQFDVRSIGRDLASVSLQLRKEIGTPIHARVGDDPNFSIQRERLVFALGLVSSPEQAVAESRVSLDPNVVCVGTAKGQKFRHVREQLTIDRRAVHIHDPDDAAHTRLCSRIHARVLIMYERIACLT